MVTATASSTDSVLVQNGHGEQAVKSTQTEHSDDHRTEHSDQSHASSCFLCLIGCGGFLWSEEFNKTAPSHATDAQNEEFARLAVGFIPRVPVRPPRI